MTPKNISSRFMSIGIFSALALLPAAFGGIPAANAQVGEDIPTTIEQPSAYPDMQEPGAMEVEQPSAYPDGAMDMDMDAESMTLLSFGSQGSDVEQLQSFLQQQGYYQDKIDGVYGQNTYSAVREFQSDNDISVDGIVGQETWSALNDTGVTSPNPNYDTTPYQNPGMTQPGGTMNTPNRNPNMNQPGSTGPFTSPGTNNIAPQAQ